MSQFTRTNGDFLPVINYDYNAYTNSGVNAISTGNTVQPQGPKLDFGTITFTGIATPTGSDLAKTIQTIQQLATVYIFEFTEVGANTDTLAVATYPTGAWDYTNAGNLDTALSTALGYSVTTGKYANFTTL